jgi:hypothetical protein
MLLEVSFMSQRLEVEGGISIQCTVSCIPPIEEIHSPVLFKSEVEQLVGQELIKALSDFKQLVVAPLSPQAHQLSSSEKDSNVEHLVDTWSISCQRKTRSEAIYKGGPRFVDKEVSLREEEQLEECYAPVF